jgi:hypothetical protein
MQHLVGVIRRRPASVRWMTATRFEPVRAVGQRRNHGCGAPPSGRRHHRRSRRRPPRAHSGGKAGVRGPPPGPPVQVRRPRWIRRFPVSPAPVPGVRERRLTRSSMVRGTAIDGHGWSAGDARNPLRIMELEMVTGDGHLTQEGPAMRRASRFSQRPMARSPVDSHLVRAGARASFADLVGRAGDGLGRLVLICAVVGRRRNYRRIPVDVNVH